MTWDLYLLAIVNQTLAHPLLDHLMAAITMITTPVPSCLFLAGVSQFRRREGRALMAAYAVSVLLAVGLQFLLGRAQAPDLSAANETRSGLANLQCPGGCDIMTRSIRKA